MIKYICPTSFDDSAVSYFPGLQVQDRDSLVSDLVSGQRVLHVGCCDHYPLIEEKMAKGQWFHDKLVAACVDVVGVDVDEVSLDLCTRLRPDSVFVQWDALREDAPSVIRDAFWDWCLLPEIVEHLDNPVDFLVALREKLGGNCGRLLCTVPNAFLTGNFLGGLHGRETVNTDHRHWYSPVTIAKVLSRAGYSDVELSMLRYGKRPGVNGVLKRLLENRFPLLASGIAITAKF